MQYADNFYDALFEPVHNYEGKRCQHQFTSVANPARAPELRKSFE